MIDKPMWAQRAEIFWDIIVTAERKMAEAQAMRCPVQDSWDAQCTADAGPEHTHRYEEADLPDYAT